MKRALFVSMILLVLSAFLFSSCKQSDKGETDLGPVFKKLTKVYKIFKASVPGDSIPFAFMITDSSLNPVENFCCTLVVDNENISYCTDSIGYILFKIPKGCKKINLPWHYDLVPNLLLSGTFKEGYTLGKSGGKIETGESMAKTTSHNIRLIYPNQEGEFAKKIMTTMIDEKEFIRNILSIEPIPWIVIMSKNEVEKPLFSLSSFYVNLAFDSISIKSNFLFFSVHEWVEVTLSDKLHIYGNKKSNRWIGDGLAQYVTFQWLKSVWPQFFCRDLQYIDSYLLNDDGVIYDLLRWKEAKISDIKKLSKKSHKTEWKISIDNRGYWYTPYFWAKIIDKSGKKNLINEFLLKFSILEVKSQDSAVIILNRLTGLDIKKELIISSKEVHENIRKYWPIPKVPENMVFIRGGVFMMGDSTHKDTSPSHKVYVNSFFLDKYEVSNEQFCKFLNAVGNEKEGNTYWFAEEKNKQIEKINSKYTPKKEYENYPVTCVSWFGARAYCKWAGKRLPTEAEWEYAASYAGRNKYPWGSEWCEKCCNWKEDGKIDGYIKSAPVDAFKNGRNIYGCYNMMGNVFEWVYDWYGLYKAEYQEDPKGPKSGSLKVHRGGCYKYSKEWENSRARIGGQPQYSYPCVGFRCAKNVFPIETDK